LEERGGAAARTPSYTGMEEKGLVTRGEKKIRFILRKGGFSFLEKKKKTPSVLRVHQLLRGDRRTLCGPEESRTLNRRGRGEERGIDRFLRRGVGVRQLGRGDKKRGVISGKAVVIESRSKTKERDSLPRLWGGGGDHRGIRGEVHLRKGWLIQTL